MRIGGCNWLKTYRFYSTTFHQTIGLLIATHHLTILIKQLNPFEMPAVPVRDHAGAAVLFLCQFCLQQDANPDAFHESCVFMVTVVLAT